MALPTVTAEALAPFQSRFLFMRYGTRNARPAIIESEILFMRCGNLMTHCYTGNFMMKKQGEVTGLLLDWNAGDLAALERLIPIVRDELRRMAGGYMRSERSDHTLDPTDLVHELYLKLVDQRRVSWNNRAHFFGCAANMMRRLLVDHARTRKAQKRGGGAVHLPLDEARDEAQTSVDREDEQILALHEALKELEALESRKARVVELHFFGGLSYQEISEVLGIAVRTIKRDWRFAKLWLHRKLYPEGSSQEGSDTSWTRWLATEPAE